MNGTYHPPSEPAAISVERLRVVDGTGHPVLDDITWQVPAGARVAVVGASGSGKTTLALALLGVTRPGLHRVSGRITVGGHDLTTTSGRALRILRRSLAYLPQDPASALTPTMRVGAQIAELACDPRPISEHLRAVGLPTDTAFQRRFPHQLSGGQRQRVALARSLATNPAALILDEPTTGLDAKAADVVLTETDRLVTERRLTLVLITHDYTAAARMVDRVTTLTTGRITRDGDTNDVLSTAFARNTLTTLTDCGQPRETAPVVVAPILEVAHLRAGYSPSSQPVADDITFTLCAGDCLAIIGPSGTGKTTLARCFTGHHTPEAGIITLNGQRLEPAIRQRPVDLHRRIQLIPQDAAGSLNPRHRIGTIIGRSLRAHGHLDRTTTHIRTCELLDQMALPHTLARRYPDQLSGGQRQRVAIARALAADPDILVCDEITSDLDPRTQTAIYNLLEQLRHDLNLAVVMISHDLTLVTGHSTHLLVLDNGRAREYGPTSRVLTRPDLSPTPEPRAPVPDPWDARPGSPNR